MNEEETPIRGTVAPSSLALEPDAGDGFPLRILWMARIALLVALGGAGYLTSIALRGGPVAGCGAGSGCDRVLSSHWAYWMGLPVGLPALVIYLSLFVATFTVSRQGPAKVVRQISLHLICSLSLLVLAAALWFFSIQRLEIHAWCKYCLATHFSAAWAACLLLGAALRRGSKGQSAGFLVVSWRRDRLDVIAAAIGLAILVTGQMAVPKRIYAVTHFPGQSGGMLTQVLLHDGRFRLDPKELPILGSATMTNFIVSFFDYTCSHCRALHPLLKAAAEKYQDRFTVIELPVPLDAECNPLILITAPANQDACEYARLGLAVCHAKREAYGEFEDWLFATPAIPPLDEVRSHAAILVGQEALDRALSSVWVQRQLETDIALYQANARAVGDGLLPQLVMGNVITHGAIETQSELNQLIEKNMLTTPAKASSQ